jgi:phosphatidylglycerophosphate synthase
MHGPRDRIRGGGGARLADAITLSRVPLTALFCLSLYRGPDIGLCAILFAAIVATDVSDGAAARRSGGCGARGERLDCMADFAFMASSCAASAHLGIVPALAPVAVCLKFAEFRLTSAVMRRAGKSPSDPLGRCVAAAFYAFPLFAACAWRLAPDPQPVVWAAFAAVAAAASLSSALRIASCIGAPRPPPEG